MILIEKNITKFITYKFDEPRQTFLDETQYEMYICKLWVSAED